VAENRVTAEDLEVAIKRTSVPGEPRVTAQILEVGVQRVDVYTKARLTAQMCEVAILTGSSSSHRSRAFFLD